MYSFDFESLKHSTTSGVEVIDYPDNDGFKQTEISGSRTEMY